MNKFIKDDGGKLRYDLLPPVQLKELVEVLTYGAKKYAPDNWKKCTSTDRYVSALYRHLEAWRMGEKIDKESGLKHLSSVIANAMFLSYLSDKEDREDNENTTKTSNDIA